MNVKLPWWFFLTLTLVLLGGSLYAGYYMGTRGSDDTIQTIRERAAADSAVWDSVRTVYDDSLSALEALNDSIRQDVDTVRIRIPVAVDRSIVAGANLQEHLEAQGDTAGLRLYGEEEEADSIVLALRISENDLLVRSMAVMQQRVNMQAQIISTQDSVLVKLYADLAEALDEGHGETMAGRVEVRCRRTGRVSTRESIEDDRVQDKLLG
jgi:hypothetical protein